MNVLEKPASPEAGACEITLGTLPMPGPAFPVLYLHYEDPDLLLADQGRFWRGLVSEPLVAFLASRIDVAEDIARVRKFIGSVPLPHLPSCTLSLSPLEPDAWWCLDVRPGKLNSTWHCQAVIHPDDARAFLEVYARTRCYVFALSHSDRFLSGSTFLATGVTVSAQAPYQREGLRHAQEGTNPLSR